MILNLFISENINGNVINKDDLEYIDNLYTSKNFNISSKSHLVELKQSHDILFSSWINEVVSPELLTYCESPIQTLCYYIYKEKEKQLISENERNLHDIIEKIEHDLNNIYIYRSICMLKMYLKQRIIKISEYPDFSIANSKLETNTSSCTNISQEEAIFATKLSKLQWQHFDDVISQMKNTLATDPTVPIPSPSLHRIIRFQCIDNIGRVQLSLRSTENTPFTQFEDDENFSQNENTKIVNINQGKIYTGRYEDVKDLLSQNCVQLWPWPPTAASRNYLS